MKMRVSIARALVTNARLILMDEPFAALDEITRQKLTNDLLALKATTGCTVIFVTHSVFKSVFLSDRILVMAPDPGGSCKSSPWTSPILATQVFARRQTMPKLPAKPRTA